jgi:hypothetical protein
VHLPLDFISNLSKSPFLFFFFIGSNRPHDERFQQQTKGSVNYSEPAAFDLTNQRARRVHEGSGATRSPRNKDGCGGGGSSCGGSGSGGCGGDSGSRGSSPSRSNTNTTRSNRSRSHSPAPLPSTSTGGGGPGDSSSSSGGGGDGGGVSSSDGGSGVSVLGVGVDSSLLAAAVEEALDRDSAVAAEVVADLSVSRSSPFKVVHFTNARFRHVLYLC